jgi:5'(3')-deoxyribonucleotidase
MPMPTRRAPKTPIPKDDPLALIDLDGTIADYNTKMDKELARLVAPGETGVKGEYLENRRKLISSRPGFYLNLKPLKLGFEVLDLVRTIGFELVVLTKASVDVPNSWSEKVQWAQKYLPDASITISQTKELVYGRVLVDDWPEYYEAWLQNRPKGLVIAVAHPHNDRPTKDQRIIRYDGTNLAQVEEALIKAYNR